MNDPGSAGILPAKEEVLLKENKIYDLLAAALDYPGDGLDCAIKQALNVLETEEPKAAAHLRDMQETLKGSTLASQQEVYTRTFDIAPICVPYVTSYIFGPESFERGEVMSKLAACYKERNFDPGNELPDHIVVLMRFSAQLNDEEMSDLIDYCIGRPLTDMVETLVAADSPFRFPLLAFKQILERRFPPKMV